MSLLGFRAAVANGIKAAIPEVKSIEPHGGRFDEGEIGRVSTAAPAIRVAILGIPETAEPRTGGSDLTVIVGAFIVTRDAPATRRDAAALALVDKLIQAVNSNRWGFDDAQIPEDVAADNLFAGKLDDKGLAIWVVHWNQQIRVGELDPETLDVFANLHADWNVGATADTPEPSDDVTELDQ